MELVLLLVSQVFIRMYRCVGLVLLVVVLVLMEIVVMSVPMVIL